MQLKNFQLFGWQGISMLIPEDWNLALQNGNFETGYIRINDLTSIRCEIKWKKSKKPPPLSFILNNYYKKMKNVAIKKKFDFKFKENVEEIKIKKENINYLTFFWESKENCYGMLWYCHNCKRIFLIQLLSNKKDIPYEIFTSLNCEGEENFNIWSIYNLYIGLPKDYLLQDDIFKSGFISLNFSNKKHNLSILRYALANIALKEKNLSEWFTENFLNIFKIYKTKEEKVILNGHKGIKIEGKRDSYIRNIVGNIFSKFKVDEKILEVFLWNCENSNRICILQSKGGEKEKRIEKIINNWRCH